MKKQNASGIKPCQLSLSPVIESAPLIGIAATDENV
jgi:hypothetical protein